uniref:Alpha/beta hydrolase fold-3 domain-containing protein n=1 Tax=Leersia perrieri TaxID=77586 RepID=A0A0D9XAI6_9ORYZ
MGEVVTTTTASSLPTPAKSTSLFSQIAVHPDGTITRPFVPDAPPSLTGAGEVVLSRDVPLDASLATSLRIYLPNPPPPTTNSRKLPIILYFHGGGFVLFTSGTVFYHASCESMAAAVPAIVVSLDYRLAPEHRLPAAYHDAVAAVHWLLAGAGAGDPWIASHGDLSRIIIMGSSSGGNMAFHASVRTKAAVLGIVLHQPYLGGEERTASEEKSGEDAVLPLEANDKLWRLALPAGEDRDHEFSNPAKSMSPAAIAGMPRILVTGSDGDPLIDRQREFVRWLEEHGVDVVDRTDLAGFHAAELFVKEKADDLFAVVRDFIAAAAVDGDR